MSTTVGASGVGDLDRLAAEGGDQLFVDDLDDLLGRREALAQVLADAALADAADQAADDVDVDVGLEGGPADLARDLVDVGVARPPRPRRRVKMPSKRSEKTGRRTWRGDPTGGYGT